MITVNWNTDHPFRKQLEGITLEPCLMCNKPLNNIHEYYGGIGEAKLYMVYCDNEGCSCHINPPGAPYYSPREAAEGWNRFARAQRERVTRIPSVNK